MDLSVIIPIFNEEANIAILYTRINKVLEPMNITYELIFVNDGSKDTSIQLIEALSLNNPQVKYIDFSRNFGHQIAVTAGLEHSIGKRIVIIDADLQDPPELILDLYKKMDEDYQVVYARRKSRNGESLLKKLTAKLFYRILSSITSIDIPVDTGDFRIIDRKVVEVLKQMPEQEKYLRGQIAWVGFKQTYIEYEREERFGGKTGYTYKKMFKFAMDGITSFSDFPLKFASMAGFIVSFFAFIVMLYSLYSKFVLKDTVQGWTSIMLSVMFIGGIQLICIGIIGEYISRIGNNIKKRPLYVINKTNVS
ncbi:glycosyltransferase family 2 protein [uncultured Cytophaga sp.]|uniref:glycosyltransferase family 2 protein n=1 Tax=uncultured Cytophaga sp. TaxID=160238 RepID=UPI002618F847|nr:glycosyltransferase family 2 protein [uncultured Cytophaga sp.]